MWLGSAQEAAFGLTLWLIGIILAVLAASAVLLYVRRRIRDSLKQDTIGFTLDEIRALRRRGEVTDEEYQVLRKSLFAVSGPSKQAQDR